MVIKPQLFREITLHAGVLAEKRGGHQQTLMPLDNQACVSCQSAKV